jgi:hypothetical protein
LAKSKEGDYYLPFRPVVFGGDDVTFVCDGRLGVELARLYASEFAKETADRAACQGRLTARAGIAIVKAHYPFARAYQLAEDLIKSAKQYRSEIKAHRQDWQGSCVDWHFALAGLSGSLDEIRQREYETQYGPLRLRPLALEENPLDQRRSWPVMDQMLKDFQTKKEWADRRNKMKALRDALREGEAATGEFLRSFDSPDLPKAGMELEAGFQKKGWSNFPDQRCLYFDAVEMSDWHIPLRKQQAEQISQGGNQNG